MAESETRWTKEKPTVEGVYWSRIDEFDKQPTPVRFERYANGVAVFEFGCAESFQREHETEDYEYLGPFTAADAEQLSELRKVAQRALTWIDELLFARPLTEQGDRITADLRAALNPKQPEKET